MSSDSPPQIPAHRPSLGGPMPPDALPRRFGKYTLLRKLASGGMAELFLALHRSVAGFEKLVVIKRILPAMTADPAFVEMLLHEARVAATLSHPNIVQTFDVDRADGTYYIAMEHVNGEDVRAVLRQAKRKGVPELPLEHALAIVVGMCAGLAYAHEKTDLEGRALGIVHRDISPQNIVVAYSGDVKLVDFGVAKSATTVEDTKSGLIKGKVPYMSPEQAAGQALDERSDVFATGIVLFELTTGRRLFKGPSEYETLKLICDGTYPRPSEIVPGYPRKLEAIVMHALEKSATRRYQTARDMQRDLETFIRDERVPVSQVTLSAFMKGIFAEKVAQQSAALSDVKQLADVIALQESAEFGSESMTGTISAIPSSPSVPSFGTAPAATASVAPAATRSRSGLYVGLGVAVAVLAVGAAFLAKRPPAPEAVASVAGPPLVRAPEPVRGKLAITSDPPGATIWVDGDLRPEPTPATLDRLPLGKPIAVKVTKDGFETWKQEITLTEAKADATLVASLAAIAVPSASAAPTVVAPVAAATPQPKTNPPSATTAAPTPPPAPAVPAGNGKLNVAARNGYCTVVVDGASRGPTPIGGIVLAAGPHSVSCKPDTGPSLSQSVKIEPDQTARISFTLP